MTERIVIIDETPAVGIRLARHCDHIQIFPIREHHEAVPGYDQERNKNHPCVVMVRQEMSQMQSISRNQPMNTIQPYERHTYPGSAEPVCDLCVAADQYEKGSCDPDDG